jgi:hypothetical protein
MITPSSSLRVSSIRFLCFSNNSIEGGGGDKQRRREKNNQVFLKQGYILHDIYKIPDENYLLKMLFVSPFAI